MYFTAWTLHLWLRPIGELHPGQGNDVLSLSTSGVPDDEQNTALFADITNPRPAGVLGSLFSVDCALMTYVRRNASFPISKR